MYPDTDIPASDTIRETLTVALTLLVALGLVTTAAGASAAAGTSTATATGDEVPEPLEDGRYSDQTLDAGETVSYVAELTAGDLFIAGATYSSDDDLEVTITDPEGNEVGDHAVGDSYHYVELPEVAHDGTYLVTITNDGDATDYEFEVLHETRSEPEPEPEPDTVPEPLEDGYYTGLEIGSGETITYEAELAANDLFNAAVPKTTGDLDVRILDPAGTAVATDFPEGNAHGGIVTGASTDGTYTVEITNTGDADMTFDLSVFHETPVVLEDGTFTGEAGFETPEYYIIDLATNDTLSVDIRSETPDALDVTAFDPAVEETGDIDRDGDAYRIELSDVETDGTYVIQLTNIAGDTVSYELEVSHEEATVSVPNGDDVDGSDSNTENDSDTDDSETDDDSSDDGDGIPGFGVATALLALVATAMVALSGRRSE